MGRKPPRRAALQPAQQQSDAEEEQRKMLNPGAVFTPAISLSKTFLVSNNISFKGKKDLSTNASVQVSPISNILTPIPPRGGSGRSQPRTGTPAGRRRTEPPPQRPAEGSDRRDSDRSRPRRGSQPRRAVPAKTSQFPGCGHRSTGGRTDGRGATLVPAAGRTCRWDPSS